MVRSSQNKEEEGAIGGPSTAPSLKPKRRISPASEAIQDLVQKARNEQKSVRTQITVTISSIYDLVDTSASRGRIRAFLIELKRLSDEAVNLHSFLSKVPGIEPAKLRKQQEDHLKYISAIAVLEECAEEHLNSRAEETTTATSQASPVQKSPVKVKSQPSESHQQEEEEELVHEEEFKDDAVDDALLDTLNQRAQQRENDLDLTAALQNTSSRVRVREWLCQQEEPFVAIRRSEDRSSLRSQLESFCGQSHDWILRISQSLCNPHPFDGLDDKEEKFIQSVKASNKKREYWQVDLPELIVTADNSAACLHHVVVESSLDWSRVPVCPKILPSLVNLDGEYQELVKRCQDEAIPSELDRLERGKAFRADSKLYQLNQRLDEKKIIRPGGHLEKPSLLYHQKHPPIPPGKHLRCLPTACSLLSGSADSSIQHPSASGEYGSEETV